MNSNSKIIKSTIWIIICTAIFKVLGFCREFALSYFWGTSGVSDAYLISQTIPGTLFDVIGTGLSTCFIPVFYNVLKEKGSLYANAFTNKMLTIILTISILLIVLVWINTSLFVKVFAVGFEDNILKLACGFTRIGILSLVFSTYVFVYGSFLQAHNEFLPSSWTAIIQAIIVLLSIIIGAYYNVWLMSIGSTIAVGMRILFLHPYVSKYGLKPRLNFHWHDIYIQKYLALLIPIVIGVAIADLNTIIDRNMASNVSEGAISALTYANSMMQLANGGVILPIVTVFFPYITKNITENNHKDTQDLIHNVIMSLMTVIIPISLFFISYSNNIIDMLFGRGAFDENSTIMTSSAFMFYSIGIVFVGVREVLSRCYFAYGDTKTPMINSSIGIICNIFFNYMLVKPMGVGGLALATSISAAIASLLMVYNLNKIRISYSSIFNFKELIKIFVATIVSLCTIILLDNYILISNQTFKFCILLLMSILTYITICYSLKLRTISYLSLIIINKIKYYNNDKSPNS